ILPRTPGACHTRTHTRGRSGDGRECPAVRIAQWRREACATGYGEGADAFGERQERDPTGPELGQDVTKLPQAPGNSVHPLNDHRLERVPSGLREELAPSRAIIPGRGGHVPVHRDELPAFPGRRLLDGVDLQGEILRIGGPAGVAGDLHRVTLAFW